MLDHVVAHRRAQHVRRQQRRARITQGVGDMGAFARIGIALERRLQLQPLFDALDPRRQQRRHRQIGVDVRSADPAFDPYRLAAVAAQAVAGGAVVDRPDDAGGGKAALLEPLVAVDVGGKEIGIIGGVFQQAGDIAFHQRRHPQVILGVEKGRLAILPQRLVHVAGRSDLVGAPLRQEGHRAALLPGDLLGRVLGDGVVIGRIQRRGVFDVELFLPGLGLALGVFHRDAGVPQVVAQRAHHVLFLGGLQDVVILVHARQRGEVAVALLAQLIKAFLEQEEFQLCRHHGVKAHRLQPLELFLEDRAGRMGDVLMRVVVEHVTEHHHRALEPGHRAQGAKIRLHHVIAIARTPGGRGIAVGRGHRQVGGQQVVAAMGLFPGAGDEMLGMEPFAQQPALHVDQAGQDRVHLAGLDAGLQILETQCTRHRRLSCSQLGNPGVAAGVRFVTCDRLSRSGRGARPSACRHCTS